jgi:hypothetical protein
MSRNLAVFDYRPDWPLFLALDFGWWNNFTGWVQPSGNGDRVIVLYGHYQEMRTNEENAKLALAIHQARGYGQLTGGWGDPSKPEALRSYSQVFGALILGAGGRVEDGHELVRRWLKAAQMTRGESGLVFSRHCPARLFKEWRDYREHRPGIGAHHSCDAVRYFLKGWTGR